MNELEKNFLMHYGIKMRSGRYKYGSGDRPYQHSQFKNAERKVRNSLSNNYKEFKTEPFDKKKADKRAGFNMDDSIRARSIDAFRVAKEFEPQITKDVINAVSGTSAKMYGLQHRLKQPTSIAGKIGSDMSEKGISSRDARDGIKDIIRYTAVSENKDFVKNYEKIKQNLEQQGYIETKCKNYFQQYKEGKVKHKAVQSNFEHIKGGYPFELQFQTPESQAAKELKVPIYEERRKQGISSKKAEKLEQKMVDLAEQVPFPPGIEKIKSQNRYEKTPDKYEKLYSDEAQKEVEKWANMSAEEELAIYDKLLKEYYKKKG